MDIGVQDIDMKQNMEKWIKIEMDIGVGTKHDEQLRQKREKD